MRRAGVRIALRPKEFELLIALLRHRDEVVPRAYLLEEVWGYESEVVTRTVDTHVMELRRKLEDDPANPKYILTVRKAGYRLALAAEVIGSNPRGQTGDQRGEGTKESEICTKGVRAV